ncbi:MAG: ABC-2 family transporter protein [Chloroflexota bacterium]|nr:ABC-2 family transporter protein [Chloroflexota bacterium]
MRIYLEIARLAVHQQLAYRAATLAGLFTNSVFGVILGSVMLGFYGSVEGDSVNGWSSGDAITLIWINQSLLVVMYLWGWWDVSRTIQTGAIASDFLRPISWYGLWLSRDFGRALPAIFLRMIPTLAIGWLLFEISLPATPARALWFLAAVVLGVWVSFSIRLLSNLLAFWLIDHRGLAAVWLTLTTFLSGMAMPIAFFPEPLRTIAELLPFQAILMSPINAWLGKGDPLVIIAIQVFWIIALVMLCGIVLKRGERRLVVQGG